MLSDWWDMKGVAYHEVLNCNETVHSERYCHQQEALNQSLLKDQSEVNVTLTFQWLHNASRKRFYLILSTFPMLLHWIITFSDLFSTCWTGNCVPIMKRLKKILEYILPWNPKIFMLEKLIGCLFDRIISSN